MKTKAKVYLWALLPLASAALFYALIAIDFEVSFLIGPIFRISVVGVLAVLAGFFATGLAGFRFAKNGVGALKAILVGNAIPILATLVYTAFVVSGNGDVDAGKVIAEFGNGIFSVVSLYVTVLTNMTFSFFEVYISFAFLIATFVVGYSVGILKNNK
ncbi:MAG: hypothetical protein IKI51_04985 [Clostridia bacterium]|nr:hypothetical protein [Clostridia bacterium]